MAQEQRQPRLLVLVSGSVAACKTPAILRAALLMRSIVRVVLTGAGARFVGAKALTFNGAIEVYTDDDEQWKVLGDKILHIELTRWADALVVLPCSADFMGKMVNGLAVDLASSCVRAWSFSKPITIFPAMNTQMWIHPVTGQQLNTLKGWGVAVVPPIEKMLACGDFGMGALPEIDACCEVLSALIDQLPGLPPAPEAR